MVVSKKTKQSKTKQSKKSKKTKTKTKKYVSKPSYSKTLTDLQSLKSISLKMILVFAIRYSHLLLLLLSFVLDE